jgi:transposase
LKEVTFVGDRGMVTQANVEELNQIKGLHTISALTHRQIVELVERKVIQAELFDEKRIAEVIDPAKPTQRYCLCRNPQTGARETATRQRLLDRTREALDKIVARKKKGSTEKLSAQVGKILARYKMGKFVEWEIQTGRLQWHFKETHIEQEKLFDGCYIVSATVPQGQMNQDEVVATYKNLSVVEQAFRNLKTVSLEIRPVYHKKDDRIRSHVFLCVLAFYLQWHMQQRLQPLFEADGEGKNRQWTVENVIERLMGIRKQRVKVAEVEFDQVTQADQEQQKILALLKVKP